MSPVPEKGSQPWEQLAAHLPPPDPHWKVEPRPQPARGCRYCGPLLVGVVNETPELNCNCAALQSSECSRPQRSFPWSQFLGATWNIANTVLGAGTLAMPYVVRCLGPAGFLVVSACLLLLTWASVHLLLQACDQAHRSVDQMSPLTQRLCIARCRKSAMQVASETPRSITLKFPNYESLALFFYGQSGAYAVIFVFVAGGIALTMAYLLLIVETLAPPVLGYRLPKTMQPAAIILIAVGALPLASVRDLTMLRWTSLLGVASLAVVSVYTVVRCVLAGPTLAQSEELVQRINLGWQMLPACSMLTSAFSCHISALPIYSGLGANRGIMKAVVPTGLFGAFIVYMGVGLGGYFLFGDDVQQNILDNFWERLPVGRARWLIYVMNACVSVALLSSVPLIIWPLRSCLLMLRHRFHSWRGWTSLSPDEVPPPEPALWFGLTAGIVTVVTCVALVVPKVAVSLSLVGAVGGAGIVFVFPSMFFLASQDAQKMPFIGKQKAAPQIWLWVARLLIVVGVVSGLLSLGVTLHGILGGGS